MLTRGLPLRERQSHRACAKLLCGVHGGVRGQPFSKPHLALSLSSVSVLPFEGPDYISGGSSLHQRPLLEGALVAQIQMCHSTLLGGQRDHDCVDGQAGAT